MNKDVVFDEINNWQKCFHNFISEALSDEYGVDITTACSSFRDTVVRFPINTSPEFINQIRSEIGNYIKRNPVPLTAYSVSYYSTEVIVEGE